MQTNISNGWTATLTSDLTDAGTSADVSGVDGIPPCPFKAVIFREGANTDEVVNVTDLSTLTLTLERAAEPDAWGVQVASAHGTGAVITHVLTAQTLNDALSLSTVARIIAYQMFR